MNFLVDITKLSTAEREHLVGFILTYPSREASGVVVSDIAVHRAIVNKEVLTAVEEIESSPEAVFGQAIPPAPLGTVAATGPHLVIPAPPAAASAGTTLDKAGLPWDVRIHSGNKAFNADGSWRMRRGVTDEQKSQVEIELRQLMAIPRREIRAEDLDPSVIGQVTGIVEAIAVGRIPPPPVAATPSTVPAVVSVSEDSQAYFALINRCSELMNSGKVQREEIQAICVAVGLKSLALLGTRKDLVPEIADAIDQLVADK